ncbi:uncharacterized protein [Nicotiana tomentosiformis]|uniref:uncharacterized protein n=1 Tax=Nicotiana tomentosiformis TaxID=4098 RepID=UPI00388C6983
MAFSRLLAQIIKLRAQFPDYAIKTIRLDNASEFTSQAFNDYCISTGITIEHQVAHVHTQNGLAESLIKRLQLIAKPMLMRTKLPISVWGHAILYATALVQIRPTSYHKVSSLKLAFGQEPNISHLRIFGCAIYVPIAPPQCTNMDPQRRLGYMLVYPTLGGENKQLRNKIDWNVLSLSHLDPRTNQCDQEVQKIIHLQNITNQLPDTFTDLPKVTKSHIPASNAPIRVDILVGQSIKANEFKPRLKHGRPIGSKDKNPQKRKGENDQSDHNMEVVTQEEHRDITNDKTSREVQVPENDKNERSQ